MKNIIACFLSVFALLFYRNALAENFQETPQSLKNIEDIKQREKSLGTIEVIEILTRIKKEKGELFVGNSYIAQEKIEKGNDCLESDYISATNALSTYVSKSESMGFNLASMQFYHFLNSVQREKNNCISKGLLN